MDLVSWDFYDKSLLGMSCYPFISKDGPQEPERIWAHLTKYLRFIEFIVSDYNAREIVVADLGCADGRFGRTLFENVRPFKKIQYIGIDLRKNIVKCIIENTTYFRSIFINANITNHIPIKNISVDIVVLSQVLKYIESKLLSSTLKNCGALLKSNGCLLVTHSLPSRYDTKNWTGFVGDYSFKDFEEALDRAGFIIKERFPIECDIKCKDKCISKAVSSYPPLKKLPKPLQVIVGLNMLPDLAQQMAYIAHPKL
ncbi:MAG: class I SAM-dependent methyltransferase [Mesoflavibacter sp.]|nr:class I SAM-dependent methyltransferase [Mesoflavibacter sp.]